MSGDWIKMQVCLPDKPEVWQISELTKTDPDAVVGKLLRIWAWFDSHTEDGNAVGVTYSLLDRIAGVTGFANAMETVGWLSRDALVFTVPKFERHNGKTAKTRALTTERVAKHRVKSCNAPSVSKTLPREEKRRSKPSIKPDGFDEFWKAYPTGCRGKTGKGLAEAAFIKAGINGSLPKILSALEAQSKSEQWTKENGQFIPNPATWLNQRRWEDELSSTSKSTDYSAGAV